TGSDNEGATTHVTLSIVGGNGTDSLLLTTDNSQISLFNESGVIVGRVDNPDGTFNATGTVAFAISINDLGEVTVAQYLSLKHPTSPDNYDESVNLGSLVNAVVTVTDGDGDIATQSIGIGNALQFQDDGPTAAIVATGNSVAMDESIGERPANSAGAADANDTADDNVAGNPFPLGYGTPIGLLSNVDLVNTTTSTGSDNEGATTHVTLSIVGGNGTDSLLLTTDNSQISLFNESGVIVGRVDNPDGTFNATGTVAFAISINDLGEVTVAQYLSLKHPTSPDNYDESVNLGSLVNAVVTVTDGDGDIATQSIGIGNALQFQDDGPKITVPFDGDPGTAGIQHETLANVLNASATGAFGYDIGADAHAAAFYTGGGSDFVDQNGALAGVQIGLTGTITGGGGGNVLTSNVTLASESLTSATFNFTFTYDKDPAAGVQAGTAGGTLVFDKVADTYTINLTDPLEGFSFDVIHTSELLSKEPTSNTGHPQIVVERLQADDPNTPDDEDFYVQFTGNAINRANPFRLTNNGEGSSADATFTVGGHEMVSNTNETWVSATQSTNGVAGDTIQKDELLTLRFFNSNVGIQSEAVTPTATAGTMAIKFDGIGNSEDLMLILDLIDKNGADNIAGTADDNSTITRAVYVSNADIFKAGQVPAAYSSEFTLDNNDGLVIIEQNDYNAAGEDYVLQGAQIMQSGNGITGNNTAIDLIRTTGAGGASNATTNLVNFDAADNDVLKITDIGFTSTVTETPEAQLAFAFQVEDADADQTAMQHILVDVA
ncbi:DUF5801 repeats-in-toxin domain-containing protein, partial [Rhizobium sullae]